MWVTVLTLAIPEPACRGSCDPDLPERNYEEHVLESDPEDRVPASEQHPPRVLSAMTGLLIYRRSVRDGNINSVCPISNPVRTSAIRPTDSELKE